MSDNNMTMLGSLRPRIKCHLLFQVIIVTLAVMSSLNVHSLSSPTPNVNRKSLPDHELINRRKSPALWREDMSLTSTNSKDPNTMKRQIRYPKQPPEVMAPCGGFPQLHAAIANGADSVYVGLTSFSARARAANFSPNELAEAVTIAHRSNVKVYVAINTLVFQDELQEVAELVRICDNVGVDALIVQDIGVTKMIQRMAPKLEIHASTQQTVTNADGVFYAKERGGATRVVLGRELSVKEIQSVTNDLQRKRNEDTDDHNSIYYSYEDDVEVEAFVHGALCVSYSGQCFSSEAWGGRSANRGQCAQACRLPYGLIRNGELVDLQDMTYLLSPQDLCGIDQVYELIMSNVSCLKIEGRLKDEKYVAATTRAYRNAVDDAWDRIVAERLAQTEDGDDDSVKSSRRVMENHETISKEELAQLFSRGQDEHHDGLTPGFFLGSTHQQLVRGRSPRNRGIHIGYVGEGSSSKTGLIISPNSSFDLSRLKLGDGLVVDRGMAQDEELGGPIYDIQKSKRTGSFAIRFGRDVERRWRKDERVTSDNTPLVIPGAHIWKTRDAQVDKKMNRLARSKMPIQKIPVQASISGKVGDNLKISITDLTTGQTGVGVSEGLLSAAEKKGLDEKSIRKAFGTLGNTRWVIDDDALDFDLLDEGLWAPISWVKSCRKHAVEELEAMTDELDAGIAFSKNKNDIMHGSSEDLEGIVADMVEESANCVTEKANGSSLSVLARNQDQVECLCRMIERGAKIDEIIIDFLEIDGMSKALSRVRQVKDMSVVLASPRIIKAGEEGIWRSLLRLEPDGILLRSTGLLHRLIELGGTGSLVDVGSTQPVRIPSLIGDFSLNAVNSLTTHELLDYGGLTRITAAYDMSAQSITELAAVMGKGASRLEVVAHCHMPVFHTEHCVFARFLSKGNSYLDCGHVCTRNNIHLRDQNGSDNLVLADMGCRNTVFSAQAQSGAHSLREWAKVGIGTIRIELVDEGEEDVETIVQGYKGVINGDIKAYELWESLENVRDSNGRKGGVSFGSLKNVSERRAGEL